MKQLQMKVPQGEWNYYRWGSGETLLVALHGFARNALLFEKLGFVILLLEKLWIIICKTLCTCYHNIYWQVIYCSILENASENAVATCC